MSGRTRQGWALILTGLMALQGCGAVARHQVAEPGATRIDTADERRAARFDAAPLPTRPTARLQPTCGPMGGFGFSGGEAAALVGFLILASPFLVVFAVITAPLEFVADRL